ncbi:MAG TPA: thiolase family protein [Methylomirabilota bacterium]|nr:thiolase family protein [Methylomirabilota bacterium]
MTPRLVIVDGVRTPFGKAGTDLSRLDAVELGRIAVTSLLKRTGFDPSLVDEVILGCVSQPADAANIARVIALRSGIPEHVPAVTVHRNCASGIEAFTTAYERMCAGRGRVFIVGGTESMSQMPLLFSQRAAGKFNRLARAKSIPQKLGALTAFRARDFKPRVGLQLGLTDPVCGLNMGETAELLAREFHISREEQDAFALESHQRTLAARHKLGEEICPVFEGRNAKSAIAADNGPRENQSLEALAKLRPVFDKKFGTVTAGNSSQITDGAVALLLMEVERARELGYAPIGALVDYAVTGCDPKRMGLGPLFAMSKLERQCGLHVSDADLIEINEAFAAQILAVLNGAESKEFASQQLHRDGPLGKISRDKLNVNGGAIALGHPVGATGARLILTSLKELQRRNARRALVSLCVGGGQGAALWLERMI